MCIRAVCSVIALFVWPVAAEAQLADKIKSRARRQSTTDQNEKRLRHNGIERSYLLHLPPHAGKSERLPLVVVLHGAMANGKITEELTGFNTVADRSGFAVVYPSANPSGGVGAWEFWSGSDTGGKRLPAKSARPGRDDFGFILALVDELVMTGVADRRRVYATGISNGAYFSNGLGLRHSDVFAAIAAVDGTMTEGAAANSKPSRPVPVFYVHGTADKLITIDGKDFLTHRKSSMSADELVAWWVKRNGARATPDRKTLAKGSDGITVERSEYAGAAPVVYYRIVGGGHTWPGGSALQPERMLGRTCTSFHASEEMWQFFRKFTLPAK